MVAAVGSFIAMCVFGFMTWLFMHGQNVTTPSWVGFHVGSESAGFICLFLAIIAFIVFLVALSVEFSEE